MGLANNAGNRRDVFWFGYCTKTCGMVGSYQEIYEALTQVICRLRRNV